MEYIVNKKINMEDNVNNLNERMNSLETQMDVIIKLLGKGISTNNIDEKDNNGIDLGTLLGLTPKQTACLQMIHEGYGTKEMSKVLDATDSTTKTHIAALFKKFHAKDRANLVLITTGAFDKISDDVYLKQSGIPKDFARTLDENVPNKYRDMLRKQRK